MTGIALIKPGTNDDEKGILFKASINFGEIQAFVCIRAIYLRQLCVGIVQLLPLLQQFSGNFIKSIDLHFEGLIQLFHGRTIGKAFKTPTEFISCLRELLPMFENCSPKFKFNMTIYQASNPTDIVPMIGSILEFCSVQASSSVQFLIPTTAEFYNGPEQSRQIEAISDWLHRRFDSETSTASLVRRFLTLGSGHGNVLNVHDDSVEHLIEMLKLARILL